MGVSILFYHYSFRKLQAIGKFYFVKNYSKLFKGINSNNFQKNICLFSVRGVLGSITILSSNMGVLIVFATGGYCDYFTTPKFSIILAALFGVLFTYFPDSPIALAKQNRLKV